MFHTGIGRRRIGVKKPKNVRVYGSLLSSIMGYVPANSNIPTLDRVPAGFEH
jgi:hypothetical protein